MADRAPEDAESARRRKFLNHFANFNAGTRFPAPYTHFAGRPLARSGNQPWVYDGLGYRNDAEPGPRGPAETLRVFVVGDSSLLEGQSYADTVPGRMETVLRDARGPGARVYNFGAISACLNQMTALITTRLMDLQADAIVVVGGSTDIFQPWSFDPRAGVPFNHFAYESLYEYFFDPRTDDDKAALSYENLQELIFARLNNLRALTHWQSEPWEWEGVRQFEQALRRLARLAPGIGAPVRFVLQPTVVRKATRVGDETEAASGDFLKYLDRQFGRFERVVREIGAGGLAGPHFAARDLGGLFAADTRSLFTDIVHYTSEGRQEVAETLAADVLATVAGGA